MMPPFSHVLYEVSFLNYIQHGRWLWYLFLVCVKPCIVFVLFALFSAMYLYSGDDSLRPDSSVLLCLLLYSDFILSVAEPVDGSSPWHRFSVPHLVAQHMRLPFLCHTHWHSSPHTQHSEKSMKLISIMSST